MSEEKLEEVISEKPQENSAKESEKVVTKRKTATRKRKTTTSKSSDEEGPVKKRKPRTTRKKVVKPSEESANISDNTDEKVPAKKVLAARKTVRRNVVSRKIIKKELSNDETSKSETNSEHEINTQETKALNTSEAAGSNERNISEPKSENKVESDFSKESSTNEVENNSNSNNRTRQNNRNTRNNNNNNSNRSNFQKNGRNNNNKNKKRREEKIEEINLDENPDAPVLFLNDYYTVSNEILRKKGIELGMDPEIIYDYKRQEIITEILKDHSRNGGVIVVEGTLEVLPDGYGFLRSSLNSYISGPDDIYVAANIIRYGALKTGDRIQGQVKTPRDSERFYGLFKVLLVDGDEPIKAKKRPNFDDLIPIFPDTRLALESEVDEDVSTRLIDLFCPIGKGQRALIVAPPRTGKTVLLQKIANSISRNNPEITLMVLLVDERPEEVTDMREQVRGEVIASTFDEQASRHVQVAEMAIEKAKRMVEHGKDVVILLDSITRLARAYNQTVPSSGKVLSGGVDSNALHKPKRFFGAARNIKGGGSLTIISTALVETGSRMDEVIFEEFKGTGNNEIVLDRRLSDRRIFPSINIKKSGTRRDDLLIPADEASKVWIIRNAISNMDDVDQTPFLIDKMAKSKNNEAFLKSINTTANMN